MRRLTMLPALLLTAQTAPPPPFPAPLGVPVTGATVVARHPHDGAAFTQGLSWCDGALYESTGHIGRSEIRRITWPDGEVAARAAIPPDLFGEGSTCWKQSLVSVTWTSGRGFRWDRASLKRTGSFVYSGEGWGLTANGRDLILSDGTADLRFMDPDSFTERRRIRVTLNGRPLARLNELEYVDDEIFANIWMTGFIARIDPASGKVTGLIDLRPLVAEVALAGHDSVANGIAYDATARRLLVTGKNWPTLFEVRLGAVVGMAR